MARLIANPIDEMVTETRDPQGRFAKGLVPHNKKPPVPKTCATCGTAFTVIPARKHKARFCSRACTDASPEIRAVRSAVHRGKVVSADTREKQRQAKVGIRGPDHWNWRGYDASERDRAMARDEYKQWRIAVFERDAFTCQACGASKVFLHAHHIKSWRDHPELRYDTDNGQALCEPCHKRAHKKRKV